MAPNLASSQLQFIHDMIHCGPWLTNAKLATAANRSKRAISWIRSNFRLVGTLRSPPNKGGRQPASRQLCWKPFVTICLKNLVCILMKWPFSFGRSLRCKRQHPVFDVLFYLEVGQKNRPTESERAELRFTRRVFSFSSWIFIHLSLFTWMNQGVIKESALDGLVGHLLV